MMSDIMKKYIVLTLALAAFVCPLSSCEEDDKSSSSVSAYSDVAHKNSSQFAESRTIEEELYMRYTDEDIKAEKEFFFDQVYPSVCDDFTDTDDDGLIDLVEKDAETDINNPDTDGDGVDDFCEIYLLSTDPLTAGQ